MIDAPPAVVVAQPCWQAGPAAARRILRGVVTRSTDRAGTAEWRLNVPQPFCVAGLAGRQQSLRLLPSDAAAERNLRAVIRLRVTFAGRPELRGGEVVLPLG